MAPDFDTGLLIPLQIGAFQDINVDFFAIEDFSYRLQLALQAHSQGKELYVWTINQEKDMDKYLVSNVDGVITDYPNIVNEKKEELVGATSFYDQISRVFFQVIEQY